MKVFNTLLLTSLVALMFIIGSINSTKLNLSNKNFRNVHTLIQTQENKENIAKASEKAATCAGTGCMPEPAYLSKKNTEKI
jgi:hypothetical protein